MAIPPVLKMALTGPIRSADVTVDCAPHAHGGIAAVIAKSYSRIFFRNAINQGLPLLTSDLVEDIEENQDVTIDFPGGTIAYPKGAKNFPALPDSVMDILSEGGLIPAVRKSLGLE